VTRLSRRALLTAPLASTAFAQRPKRPNILFAISDDQSFAHTGAAGDVTVRTPTFDRIAAEGVRFSHAYCSSPSCTPSRSTILTGQHCFRLGEAANLWSSLDARHAVYPDLLEEAGYRVGFARKGWGPGEATALGRKRNPAGDRYSDFETFYSQKARDQPFCFWFGSHDPHRPYQRGSGLQAGLRLDDVRVPAFLPDAPEIRSDLLDYYAEIERFDSDLGRILSFLEERDELDQTLVVVTSDNGMPFPRAKTNLYDYGARLPLAVRWPERVRGGRVIDDFVSFADFAPTFLAAAGLEPPPETSGRSFLDLLESAEQGRVDPARDHVVLARERHTLRREGRVGYPMRAIRTWEHLYIRNLAPERAPAGDAPRFGDCDGGPSKDYILARRESPAVRPYFDLAFGKRPAEELYDHAYATEQTQNVAERSAYAQVKRSLADRLDAQLRTLEDPRILGRPFSWDDQPYYGRGG